MKYLFIDIRKSDEAYRLHFTESIDYCFYNIPMNMIKFNVNSIIKQLKYVDEIYIVCESASRSQFIKNKYFKDYEGIKVNSALQFSNFKYGINKIAIKEQNLIQINISGSNSFNYYSVMRILQTILGSIMIFVGLFIYFQLKNKKLLTKINYVPLIILVLFGIMALYNGLTSTCSLSNFLIDYLN